MGIEYFGLPGRLLSFVPSVILLTMSLISIVMIVAGITGSVIAGTKHMPKNKWVSFLKRGFIIFLIGIFAYIVTGMLVGMFGIPMSSSFTGDTQVWTPEGRVRIADLNEGDEVLGFDVKTNQVVTEAIEQCRSYKVNSYYLINGTLKVTSEHPFAVRQSESTVWKKVKELAVGDELMSADTLRPLIIESIEAVSIDNSVTVYNPQVSGSHSYFVFLGNNAALVHNKTKLPTLEPLEQCSREDK